MDLHSQRNLTTQIPPIEGQEWTTHTPLTPEEEDAIVTLVVVVLGVIIAIIFLFSMGVFLDCKHQKDDSMKKKNKKRLRLKMPALSRGRSYQGDDGKYLASDMCPNGTTDFGSIRITGDAAV